MVTVMSSDADAGTDRWSIAAGVVRDEALSDACKKGDCEADGSADSVQEDIWERRGGGQWIKMK